MAAVSQVNANDEGTSKARIYNLRFAVVSGDFRVKGM